MALQKTEKKTENSYEYEFLIEKDIFEEGINKAYRRNVGKLSVPGFRKGKAPRGVIEKMYGRDVFYEEAIDDILPDLFKAELDKKKLEVVGRPESELVSVDENGALIKINFFVKPEVTLEQYKGLEVERNAVVVTDEDIEAEILAKRKRNSRELTVESGAAADGDEALIDFEGFLDGVAFEGGKGENYPLKIGSGSFIPGFEEQIIGKEIGSEFDITVSFPEDYGAKELAGKETVFKIKLHSVKRTELPAADDEFAKDVSEFDTFAEYRESVRKDLTEKAEKKEDSAVETRIFDKLIENMKADIPECMFEEETDSLFRDYTYRITSQGITLEMFSQYTGQTQEQMRDSFKEQAIRNVKLRLALEKVAKTEKFKAGKKEIEEEYKKIAAGYTMELDDVKARIPESGMAEDVVMGKANDLVKAEAVIKQL